VREIPLAGVFVASGVPTEAPLADDLRKRGIKASGTYIRLIVPDGIARVEMRVKGAKTSVRVRGNAAVGHMALRPDRTSKLRFVFFDARGNRVRPA
jgi:hypothetical protein